MFLEYWMIGIMLFVWFISLVVMYRDGFIHGIHRTFDILEKLEIIEVSINKDGEEVISKKD